MTHTLLRIVAGFIFTTAVVFACRSSSRFVDDTAMSPAEVRDYVKEWNEIEKRPGTFMWGGSRVFVREELNDAGRRVPRTLGLPFNPERGILVECPEGGHAGLFLTDAGSEVRCGEWP